MDSVKCQTPAASPAEPGELPFLLAREYETELQRLREQLDLLLAKRFGPSSERISPDQLRLFNEAESDTETLPEEAPVAVVPVAAHERTPRGRKPLPDYLPRVRLEHDLRESEKTCPCGGGLTRIGEATSEPLDSVPAQVRFKYACQACEETIQTAALPAQPIPKSNASPDLLAHFAVAKYQDALPWPARSGSCNGPGWTSRARPPDQVRGRPRRLDDQARGLAGSVDPAAPCTPARLRHPADG